jgi:hypothetical protein
LECIFSSDEIIKNRKMEIDEFLDKVERGEKIDVQKPKTLIEEVLDDMAKKDMDKIAVCDKLMSELKKNLERINEDSSSAQVKINNIKELLLEIRNKIAQNDILVAKEIHHQITDIFDIIPDDFSELKNELKKDISAIEATLIPKIVEFQKKDFERKKNIIMISTNNARKFVKDKQLSSALNEYRRCQELYHSLPEGFMKEKIEIYITIVELYKELLILAQISNLQNQLEF